MKQQIKCAFTVLLLIALCASECLASKKKKIPPDPKFMAIQSLSVLPIVDTRAGDKASVNIEKLQGRVVNLLKRKNYPASRAADLGEDGHIAVEDLESAAPSYIQKLGPADARWVMIVCLDDLNSRITFGSTGNAELSGYLFDRNAGELVWKGKGVGQAGQGGLAGMMMKGMMKGEALDTAVYNLLGALPKRPKPGK